jgi:hypothetical protein
LPNLISIGCGDGERVTDEVEERWVKRVEEDGIRGETPLSPGFFARM